jgi:hypothetical protein
MQQTVTYTRLYTASSVSYNLNIVESGQGRSHNNHERSIDTSCFGGPSAAQMCPWGEAPRKLTVYTSKSDIFNQFGSR